MRQTLNSRSASRRLGLRFTFSTWLSSTRSMSSRGGHTEWENVVHFSTYFWSQTGPLGAPKLDLNSCQAWLPSVTANEVHFWCTKTRPTSEPKLDHFWSHWIHPPPQGPTTNLLRVRVPSRALPNVGSRRNGFTTRLSLCPPTLGRAREGTRRGG